MKRRTALIVFLVIALIALVAAPAALAGAGGGSSGFGGGGGGGGGRGAGLYVLIQILIRIAFLGHGLGALVLIGLIVVYLLVTKLAPAAEAGWSERASAGRRARRRTAQRQRRVEAAAAEAAEDDATFAPDVVKPAAERLFLDIQRAWDRADRPALRRLVAPDLLKEWERRLDDFDTRGWRNHVTPLAQPTVEYVGLRHTGDSDDHVVVRIEARLRDYVVDRDSNHLKRRGHVTETANVREFWTLTKHDGRWMLASIEQGAEGSHALEERIVATPWSDEEALRDEALVEGAVADALPPSTSTSTNIAELASVDFDGDARAAALDLSLADARFAPDVLEVAARRATRAWAAAVDGDDSQLHQIADPLAARELLHPADPTGKTRLVVRGPQVNRIRIKALDTSSSVPTMTVEVDLTGRRYLEDRDTTAVLAGSRRRPTSFTERWTFALNGDGNEPWRIVAVHAPVGLP